MLNIQDKSKYLTITNMYNNLIKTRSIQIQILDVVSGPLISSRSRQISVVRVSNALSQHLH